MSVRQFPFADIYKPLGQLVRAFRTRAGLSQQELADKIGLTRTSVTNIEKGRQRIPLHLLFALADALKVAPRQLLPSGSVTLPNGMEAKLPKEFDEAQRRALRRIVS